MHLIFSSLGFYAPTKIKMIHLKARDFTIIGFARNPGLYNTNNMGFKSIHKYIVLSSDSLRQDSTVVA